MPLLLPATSSLARPCARSFSILSWNILLPNSHDGWWIYKYYPPGVAPEQTRWAARSALIESTLLASDADIVCLQECSAKSFASDFKFLLDAGWDAALHGKGRMRPATLWRSDRMRLCPPDGSELPPEAEEEPAPALAEAEGEDGDADAGEAGEVDPAARALVARLERKRCRALT